MFYGGLVLIGIGVILIMFSHAKDADRARFSTEVQRLVDHGGQIILPPGDLQ